MDSGLTSEQIQQFAIVNHSVLVISGDRPVHALYPPPSFCIRFERTHFYVCKFHFSYKCAKFTFAKKSSISLKNQVLTLNPWIPVMFALSAALEEVIFRAGLQEAMLRAAWPLPLCNVITALGFALAHGLTRSWLLAAAVLPTALLIGSLYGRQRRVWPCVMTHASLNLAWWGVLVAGVPHLL